ncbi:MAG: DNA repair exonuclease [Acutalibacteraceae bacterium]|nr:DNA repair exonuclease [Acutalibacteraceae bacterium]
MNTVKILHCADVHIGAALSFLGDAAAQRRYETLLTFERIVDTASKEGVRIIAAAGDIFDSNKVEDDFVDAVFEKIASVPDIKVVFSAGNHDPLSADSPFKNRNLPQNLFVLGIRDDCIVFDDIKTRVYGSSFDDVYLKGKECFSITPPDDGYVNLMVLHGEVRSDLNSNYNSVTADFIKESGMDYIALGHVHKRTEPQKLGNTYYAYCGCPEGQGFDETDEKGVYIGEIGKGLCNLSFVPMSKRRHICEKTDITGINSSAEISAAIVNLLTEKYGAQYGENLYKIELVGSKAEDFNLNSTEVLSRISDKVYFAKIKDRTELLIDTEKLAREISLKGLFVKNMLEKIRNAPNDERQELENALKLGLRAFSTEVAYNED